MSSTTPEDIEKEQRKKNEAKAGGANTKEPASPGGSVATKAESGGEHESDIHIITRAVYRDNDEGSIPISSGTGTSG